MSVSSNSSISKSSVATASTDTCSCTSFDAGSASQSSSRVSSEWILSSPPSMQDSSSPTNSGVSLPTAAHAEYSYSITRFSTGSDGPFAPVQSSGTTDVQAAVSQSEQKMKQKIAEIMRPFTSTSRS